VTRAPRNRAADPTRKRNGMRFRAGFSSGSPSCIGGSRRCLPPRTRAGSVPPKHVSPCGVGTEVRQRHDGVDGGHRGLANDCSHRSPSRPLMARVIAERSPMSPRARPCVGPERSLVSSERSLVSSRAKPHVIPAKRGSRSFVRLRFLAALGNDIARPAATHVTSPAATRRP